MSFENDLFEELQEDESLTFWIKSRLIDGVKLSNSCINNYKKGFAHYLIYIRNNFKGMENVTAENLIVSAEHEQDSRNGVSERHKKTSKYLNGFFTYAQNKYKPKTVMNYMYGIFDFYRINGIRINQKEYTIKNVKADKRNIHLLKVEEIQLGMKNSDDRSRAMILTQVSSGITKVDLIALTVGSF